MSQSLRKKETDEVLKVRKMRQREETWRAVSYRPGVGKEVIQARFHRSPFLRPFCVPFGEQHIPDFLRYSSGSCARV